MRNNRQIMKILSIVICFCLVLSCAPISVFAVAVEGVGKVLSENSTGNTAVTTQTPVPCENDGCTGTYENGICSLDGTHYQSATLNADGVYEIANAGNLYWFAAKVNGGENTISGELTADITVNKNVLKENGELNGDGSNFKAWSPIGNSDFEYKGKFDGKNHTVSGLYFNDPNAKCAALFAYTYGAGLKNIGVVDSFFRGAERIAVVVAHARHRTVVENCFNKGTVKSNTSCGGVIGFLQYDSVAKKCYNFGLVEITCENSYGGVSAGGVVGATYSSTVENSYNLGVLKKSDTNTNSYIGGVVGSADKTNVKNCYNVGTIVGSENIGAVIGDKKSNSTVTDCYYQKGVADKGTGSADSDVAGQTTVKTAEQFASGEVTYLLNGGVTDGTQAWYQTCGEGLPSFSGKTVYNNGSYGYGNYQSPAVENGTFQIANAGNLMWFAEYVNAGNKNANAVLTADIDMSGYDWVTIGSTGLYYSNTYSSGNYPDKGYSGTFDGNYHKISNLSVTSEADVSATYGLFGTLSGTVKNLGMTNFKYTHKASDMRVGAVVGQIIGGSVLNCYVLDSTITPGTNVAGGIAGCNYGGLIEGCYVYGSNVSAGRSGYIVADNRADASGDRIGTVKNCYSNGAIVGIYTGNEVDSGTKNSHRFENGEVTYLLNGGNPDGVWKLSNGLPSFVGEKMYRNTCEGDVFYSSASGNFASHDFGDDFVCKNCGEYDMPEIKNGVYQIASVSELYAYGLDGRGKDAVLLNDLKIGTKENPCVDWKAINIDSHGTFDGQGHTIELYATYSNVGGTMDATPVGLFGGNYVTIQNFTLKGSIVCNTNGRVGGVNCDGYAVKFYNIISYLDIENKGTGYTGGIVGEFGQNAANGSVINNCAVYADISGKSYVGGLVGAGWNGNQYWKITNSMYCGKVSGRDGVTGALVGYSKTDANSSKVVIDNCYYINKYASVGGSDRALGTNNSTAVTKYDFVRGAVAYLINGGVTDGTQAWYQTLPNSYVTTSDKIDEYPVLDGKTVYRVTATGCTPDGYGYTNSSDILSMNVSHSENSADYDNGICKICGAYEPCAGLGTETAPYKIANAGNLYWFAAKVNGGESTICGELTKDITVNENVLKEDGSLNGDGANFKAWVPIGASYSFAFEGKFDGNNYTVSGLYYNYSREYYVGFIGYGRDSTIQNLGIVDSYFAGDSYVGGIAGFVGGQTVVSNCYNKGTLCGSYDIGGIVGHINNSDTIAEKCYNSGKILGGRGAGGIVGYAYGGLIRDCYNIGPVSGSAIIGGVLGCSEKKSRTTVKNCHNTGSVSGSEYVGGILGFYGDGFSTINNCYYLKGCAKNGDDVVYNGIGAETVLPEDVEGQTDVKTSEQFERGEVAYLLQSGVTPEKIIDENGKVTGTKIPLVWGQRSNLSGAFPEITSNEEYRVIPVVNGEMTVGYSLLHKGDINSDGVVDVFDYQSTVNIALSENNTKDFSDNYDYNSDGTVDVLDVQIAQTEGVSDEICQTLVGLIENSESVVCYCKNSDINSDGVADVLDCADLEKMLNGHYVKIS